MTPAVKRRYDNSRRQAQSQATRASIIDAARTQFTEHGYPAATLEAIAAAAGTSPPTLYRLFSSKRALLKAVLDVTLGGDDQPITFGDRPEIQAARAQRDASQLIAAFARIGRDFMDRSAPILHVLATAAQVDPDAAQLAAEIRRQRHEGQSRIITALANLGALDPDLDPAEAADIAYAVLSPDVHRILTAERGWTGDQYERWLTRSLGALISHPATRLAGGDELCSELSRTAGPSGLNQVDGCAAAVMSCPASARRRTGPKGGAVMYVPSVSLISKGPMVWHSPVPSPASTVA